MDQATITTAVRGDRSAIESLLRHLQDPWYRLCLGLLGDAELARDATQEAALRFLRQLPGFRGESQLRTWALGIAINVVREMRRARSPGLRLTDALEVSDPAPQPAEMAEAGERCETLHAALAGLPDRQREVVVLRYFEELTTEQAAEAMHCAPGTVKATLFQALRALRRTIKGIVPILL